jgi:PPM family protein phosphatase
MGMRDAYAINMLDSVSYSGFGSQEVIRRFVPASRRQITSPAKRVMRYIDAAGRTELHGMDAFNDEQYIVADLDHHIVIRQTSVPAGKRASQGKLLAIADGISGIGASDVAGMAAMDGVLHYITSAMPWILTDEDEEGGPVPRERVLDNLKRVLVRCEHRLRRVAEARGIESSLTTAITLAYVMWPDLYVAHAGESRCYIFRDHRLHRITSDHALARPLDEEAGSDSMVSEADAHHVTLAKGDCILLCTNSLTRYLSDDEIAQYLSTDLPSATVRDRLIVAAKESGSTENITVVTCRCD